MVVYNNEHLPVFQMMPRFHKESGPLILNATTVTSEQNAPTRVFTSLPRGWSADVAPYQCPLCGKTYRTHDNLRRHVKTHSNPYCTLCSQVFSSKDDLMQHREQRHGDKNKYICPYERCGRVFNREKKLQLHLYSHVTNNDFPCVKCWQMFNSQNSLDLHMSLCKAGAVQHDI